jgi:hypothetical protein
LAVNTYFKTVIITSPWIVCVKLLTLAPVTFVS